MSTRLDILYMSVPELKEFIKANNSTVALSKLDKAHLLDLALDYVSAPLANDNYTGTDIYKFYGAEIPGESIEKLYLEMHNDICPDDPDLDDDKEYDISIGCVYDFWELGRWLSVKYGPHVKLIYTSTNNNNTHIYLIVGKHYKNEPNALLQLPTDEQITQAKQFLSIIGVDSEILPTLAIDIDY